LTPTRPRRRTDPPAARGETAVQARSPAIVAIHYLRPPDRLTVFRQQLVAQAGDCTVTLMERTPLAGPIRVDGRVILEPGAPVLWFTFAGAWHDIGRFHDASGRFTGWYANVLTPVRFLSAVEWETTDLYLDVWLGADGAAQLLDREELEEAVAAGWVDAATAAEAEAEADRLLARAAAGEWPPAVAREWTLERARIAVAGHGTRDGGGV
jgi:predicted RNA-binding protein associated with RNAse of E/G family